MTSAEDEKFAFAQKVRVQSLERSGESARLDQVRLDYEYACVRAHQAIEAAQFEIVERPQPTRTVPCERPE